MHICKINYNFTTYLLRKRPRGLRRGSEAARLVGLWVRIPPCVLSSTGFCVGLITHPQEAYRLLCVLSELVKPG
jgi:hypothetical protein